MQKLDKPISKEYGPVRLWASDLTALISTLKECENVSIVADDVKYESIDELIHENKGLHSFALTISSIKPYLIVNLGSHKTNLYVGSSNVQESGLFFKIDSILSGCERRPKFLYNIFNIMIVIPLSMPIALSISMIYKLSLNPIFNYSVNSFYSVALPWLGYVFYINAKKHSLVFPVYREDRPNFIKRNFEKILIVIISTILGAIIGAVTTKVIDKYW